ncbi:MAG: hypothetical protein HQL56_15355 [Magnetococcales bacterium]|nr:hypothetical protein [Magnetococcales bacterium]
MKHSIIQFINQDYSLLAIIAGLVLSLLYMAAKNYYALRLAMYKIRFAALFPIYEGLSEKLMVIEVNLNGYANNDALKEKTYLSINNLEEYRMRNYFAINNELDDAVLEAIQTTSDMIGQDCDSEKIKIYIRKALYSIDRSRKIMRDNCNTGAM